MPAASDLRSFRNHAAFTGNAAAGPDTARATHPAIKVGCCITWLVVFSHRRRRAAQCPCSLAVARCSLHAARTSAAPTWSVHWLARCAHRDATHHGILPTSFCRILAPVTHLLGRLPPTLATRRWGMRQPSTLSSMPLTRAANTCTPSLLIQAARCDQGNCGFVVQALHPVRGWRRA